MAQYLQNKSEILQKLAQSEFFSNSLETSSRNSRNWNLLVGTTSTDSLGELFQQSPVCLTSRKAEE